MGEKNASLGEMIRALKEKGIRVPGGFATAEDLPEASFAGQHETSLNIADERELLEACRRRYAMYEVTVEHRRGVPSSA